MLVNIYEIPITIVIIASFSFLNLPVKLTIRIKPQHRHLADILYYWK